MARIEADTGLADDQGVGRKTRILSGIRNDERFVRGQYMGAEGNVPGGLPQLDAKPGLEALAIVGNERKQGDRGVQRQRGYAGDPVEALFAIELEQPQRIDGSDALRVEISDRWHGRASMSRLLKPPWPSGNTPQRMRPRR